MNAELIELPSLPVASGPRPELVPRRLTYVSDDEGLVRMWLHDKAEGTKAGYATDYARFRMVCRTPLRLLTLEELQAFEPVNLKDSARPLSKASRNRAVASVKALLSFAHLVGYLENNVGKLIKMRPLENQLAERILPKNKVLELIEKEENTRNRVLLRFLYGTGGRVSEVCELRWKKVHRREDGTGQVTFFGKGGKTRHVFLTASVLEELISLRGAEASDESPVFPSRQSARRESPGLVLSRKQVWRIARAAARRAGIKCNFSPHWFRHANASHSLDNGAPLHVVQAALGHSSLDTTSKYTHVRPHDGPLNYLAVY